MNLSTIQAIKDQFKSHLQSREYNGLYKWKSLKTFKDNWDLDDLDLKSMYERSFANTLANPLWEGTHYYPKKSMSAFIGTDKELVRTMFRELFNESLDIDGRMDRFSHHCDEIRFDIMRTRPDYQPHYHDDHRMTSIYLAFKYPTQYCIYDFRLFKYFMDLVNAKPLPTGHDVERFFKVMRTVYKIISKDEELMQLHAAKRAKRSDLWQGESLLMCHDLLQQCEVMYSRGH